MPPLRLWARIRKCDLEDGFSARDVQRKAWSGLTDGDAVKAGLELLADLNWIEARTAEARALHREIQALARTARATMAKIDLAPEDRLPRQMM